VIGADVVTLNTAGAAARLLTKTSATAKQ